MCAEKAGQFDAVGANCLRGKRAATKEAPSARYRRRSSGRSRSVAAWRNTLLLLAPLLLPYASVGAEATRQDPPAPQLDAAAILRELTDFSVAGVSRRLGPDYDFYHPGSGDQDFPDIYLVPMKSPPPEAGPDIKRLHYQLGGPWTKDAGDFSSTQGQILYVPDRKLAVDRSTQMPNEGIGVDRVTIIEMSNGCFTEKPEPPWWGGFRPDPTAKAWLQAAGGKIGTPIASARGMGGWANSGLIVFSSGFIGTAGTVTARGTDPTFTLPPNKRPTAISITSKNEFALVTVVDTESMKGQVAVFALTGDAKKAPMPHDSHDEYPGLPNVAVFSQIKLLGYVDLPGIMFPTGISAVGSWTEGRMNGRDGNAGMLSEYSLSNQGDRDIFNTGPNAHYASTAGFAVVIAKYEGKAVFIDLQALFAGMRTAYFTTEENYQKTRAMGDGPRQWPYTFEGEPAWRPDVVKILDVPEPTAVLASLDGNGMAAVASMDGTIAFYQVGGLANEAPAAANEISGAGTLKVGRNPVCLAYQKYYGGFLAVSRGDREIAWINGWGKKASVTRRLRDRRLVDPVCAETADTHGIEGPFVTVADFKGRKILNYRYGPLVFATQGGARFGVGPTGNDPFECGGTLALPGHPFSVSATNVN